MFLWKEYSETSGKGKHKLLERILRTNNWLPVMQTVQTTTRVETMQLQRIIQNSFLTLEKVIKYVTSSEADKSFLWALLSAKFPPLLIDT